MYFIQNELYNIKEKKIPSLKYNEEDFLKWLVNIAWQNAEMETEALWNMHRFSIQPIYEMIQMLIHIYGLNIETFEKIISSIDDQKQAKLEEQYYKVYDRNKNDNVSIYSFELFSGFRFLFEYFITEYVNGEIFTLIVCKDCREVFFERESYWHIKDLCVPKRCYKCRQKRKKHNKDI